MIERHLPLISMRICFASQPAPPTSIITPRINLNGVTNRLKNNVAAVDHTDTTNVSGVTSKPKKRVVIRQPTDHSDVTGEDPSGEDLDGEVSSSEGPPAPSDPEGSGESEVGGSEVEDGLICKPSGEPGRPRSGGYNLEDTLGWPKDAYEALVVS
jgi:hypothetical protein